MPLGDRDQQGQLSLSCPTCRHVTPIPDRGVAGLKPAFHINHLLEIYKDSVKKLYNPAATPEGAVGGTKVDRYMAEYCFEHAEEELKLYCETCGELVCLQCVIQGGKHHDHDHALLKVAFEKYKEEITSSLEPMEKQVMIVKNALAELNTRCGEISNQQAAIEDNIHVTFRQLREVLTVRETELIGQLQKMTQVKLKGLEAQSDQIETTLGQLTSCLKFMEESLRTSSEGDMLMMKASTVQQVKELTTPFQQDMLKPNTEANLILSMADLTVMCQNYGQILLPCLPDPLNCRATGKGLDVAIVEEKSTVILQAVNFRGKPYNEEIKSMNCKLVSEITGKKQYCCVERRGQSQYEISYEPTFKGRHQLHVIVEGQHIKGSPFSVAVKSPVEKLGIPILTKSRIQGPWGVAINNKRGEVVISSKIAHCVSVLSPVGEKLRTFGTRGSCQGQFRGPRGLAVDPKGNIFVADSGNHRIQKFTAEGQFLAAVGVEGSGPLEFSSPVDITSSKDKVYVVDRDNHRVQVLNSDLTFSCTFGKKGSGKGQFHLPSGIACDSSGKVYVSDGENHRIQVFTADEKFLRTFGRRGQGSEELGMPIGITVDAYSGLVYVSEAGNDRVSVYTPKGQCVTSFGHRGEEPGEFNFPTGIAVDNSGVVYVCDSLNYLVQVF